MRDLSSDINHLMTYNSQTYQANFAAIFDMDGVVTDTAELHSAAWKLVFDEFLAHYALINSIQTLPFTDEDYLYYVDGVSRFDGVKNFLASRQIALAEGLPTDKPSQITLHGLAKRKDRLFLQLLQQKGVKQFASSIQLIKQLRQLNFKTAIVSASKNCKTVLQRANIEYLFDVRVDGNFLEQKKLPGKPKPDIFLEAAKQLQVIPSNAMIVEDALAGVQAGATGKFGLVVGIDRHNLGKQMFKEYGADIVVNDLAELRIDGIKHWFSYVINHVFENTGLLTATLVNKLANKRLALFLDYDGTLAPIVERPELAELRPEIRELLQQLSNYYPVAIISGRELSDLQDRVGLKNIYYAGNHGLEVIGPSLKFTQGTQYIEELAQVYQQLYQQLRHILGILIENKRFSLSIHYRLVAESSLSSIQRVINQILQQHPQLIRCEGKKVFEIRPNIDWHKGKAVCWLLTALQLEQPDVIPIYIGDDNTDEDAFRMLKQRGIGIIVSKCKQTTAAQYCLFDTTEVQQFLATLLRGAKNGKFVDFNL